jgi:hypothetical protein
VGRIYAKREDNGERILFRLECDNCGKLIKPNKDISKSGWIKKGNITVSGESYEYYYCEDCSYYFS